MLSLVTQGVLLSVLTASPSPTPAEAKPAPQRPTVQTPANTPAPSTENPTPPTLPEAPGTPTEPTPSPSPDPEGTPPEPTPPGPAPEAQPLPEPAPEPAPGPTPEVAAPLPEAAPLAGTPSLRDYVTVNPPRWRGTGQFVAAGSLYFIAVAFQAGDTFLCGECATGVLERAFLGASMGLAAGGGVVRARADAYDDTALGRERPDTRKILIAGATLTGVGAVMGLVNEGLWWSCAISEEGPYFVEPDGDFFDFSTYPCRYGVSRVLLDVASGTTAAGLGMLTWSLVYRRHAKAYGRARVIGLAPEFSSERIGLTVQGRF